jgi:hypothetical protein
MFQTFSTSESDGIVCSISCFRAIYFSKIGWKLNSEKNGTFQVQYEHSDKK